MRPNTHFEKADRKFMIIAFKEKINHAFTKAYLKNK